MRWNSIFGTMRYQWIYDEYKRVTCFFPPSSEEVAKVDMRLKKIIRTWNPQAPPQKLFTLLQAIQLRKEGAEIYPITLICFCIISIDIKSINTIAWDIIDAMFARRTPNDGASHVNYGTDAMNVILGRIKSIDATTIGKMKIARLVKIWCAINDFSDIQSDLSVDNPIYIWLHSINPGIFTKKDILQLVDAMDIRFQMRER